MEIAQGRVWERIIIALGGVLSIYLGYELFSIVPSSVTGDGSFKFPEIGEIVFTRVGPGVFFALFGAAILGIGLWKQMEVVTASDGAGVSPQGDAHDSFRYEAALDHQQRTVELQSCLNELNEAISEDDRSGAEQALAKVNALVAELAVGNSPVFVPQFSKFSRVYLDRTPSPGDRSPLNASLEDDSSASA